jgi:hypothetical protein
MALSHQLIWLKKPGRFPGSVTVTTILRNEKWWLKNVFQHPRWIRFESLISQGLGLWKSLFLENKFCYFNSFTNCPKILFMRCSAYFASIILHTGVGRTFQFLLKFFVDLKMRFAHVKVAEKSRGILN